MTLSQKRAIVDRFHDGESMAELSVEFGLGVPAWEIENLIRWSHKNKVERRRVWRRITRAGKR